jgi:hypothetical protein
MPLIRCSKEVHDYLTRLTLDTGEPVSIILDRWMHKHKQEEGHADSRGSQSGTAKRTRRADKKPGTGAKKTAGGYAGIKGLTKD